jgi:NAD(P)-dependent dehydrogenase (short-subunit alcohol dehydrogenase family)
MHIEGSVALVTAANCDIGRAFTSALLEQGASKVYATARRPEAITDPRLVPMRLDVTDADSVAVAAEGAKDVSLLVNVAGGGGVLDVLTGSLDIAREEMATNLFGTWAMAQAFAPILGGNGGGAMVMMLSVTSWAAVPQLAAYSAAKAAEWSLTNSLRSALAAQGTSVVGVHAYWVETVRTHQLPVPKISPLAVAEGALAAVRDERNEVLLDDPTRETRAALGADIGAVRLGKVFG